MKIALHGHRIVRVGQESGGFTVSWSDAIDVRDRRRNRVLRDEGRGARRGDQADVGVAGFVYDVACEAEVLRFENGAIDVEPAWNELSFAEQATDIVGTALSLGIMSSRVADAERGEVLHLVEAGIPHWLMRALKEHLGARPDTFVDQAIQVVRMRYPDPPEFLGDRESSRFERTVEGILHEVFDALDAAGIIVWSDRKSSYHGGTAQQYGGTFEMTALGRHATVDWVREAGYSFDTIDDLSDAPVGDVVAASAVGTLMPDAAIARWRPDAPTIEKARELAGHAMDTERADERITVMAMLALLEPVDEVAPAVRQMLDSPCAGHAVMFLLDRDLADADTIGPFLDLGPLVDLLSTLLDTPDVAAQLFTGVRVQADSDLVEAMVRHDQPETADVLDTLGKHLDDKQTAKTARKAAMRHRSWIANRRHRA